MGIAQALAAAGNEVTLLWIPEPGQISEDEASKLADAYYDLHLIRLDILQQGKDLLPYLGYPQKKSAAVYYHLKEQNYDAVFFALEGGLAYYSLIARELGLFEDGPELAIVAQSPLLWLSEADHFFLSHLDHLACHHMEKMCVELADEVVCLSKSFVKWLKSHGWASRRPPKVIPSPLPREWRVRHRNGTGSTVPPREIVLLAGGNYREGLTVACDMLDELANLAEGPLTVTAFGWFSQILGEHTGGMLVRRARRWPFKLQLFPSASVRQVIEYCVQRHALAVVPALAASSGHHIAACLDAGIPFVAIDTAPNDELVPSKGKSSQLAPARPKEFAAQVNRALASRPTLASDQREHEIRQSWVDFAETLQPRAKTTKRTRRKQPLVSIVMAHYNRPAYLLQAVEAIENQTYRNIELIVVDDGSTLPEAKLTLERLRRRFAKRGWKVISQANKYLGAARNTGVKASRGEYVLFVDDDNALFRAAVEKFVACMETSGADICTAFAKIFYGDSVPLSEQLNKVHYLPLGGSLDLGLIQDSFGDANAMVRRTVFDKIGLQNEEYGCTVQDWEFFARATLAGLKVRVIPEPVYWYRSSTEGMYRTSHWYKNRQPIIAAFKDAKFKGLDVFYHLALSRFSPESEINGLRENLRHSESDRRYLQLSEMDPNSPDALELLAQIAASEGRAETAIILTGALGRPGFRYSVDERLGTEFIDEGAYQEIMVGLTSSRAVGLEQLRRFELASSSADDDFVPMSYVEPPDRLFVQATGEHISIALLPAACPTATQAVRAVVSLEQELAQPVLAKILAVPFHADPVLAALTSFRESPQDWASISTPFSAVAIETVMNIPTDRPMNLVLALRARDGSSTVLARFSEITVTASKPDVATRRPRIGAPPDKLRARSLGSEEYSHVHLLTNVASRLPMLMLAPEERGIFLRPSESGPVVARITGVVPPFARGVLSRVEIAHDDASPFEFAAAIVEPNSEAAWVDGQPSGSLAFSGWVQVKEGFKLHDVEAKLSRLAKSHLDLLIAIRLPPGSLPSPANSFWRQFVLVWDE